VLQCHVGISNDCEIALGREMKRQTLASLHYVPQATLRRPFARA
jgi:hypothetical protein